MIKYIKSITTLLMICGANAMGQLKMENGGPPILNGGNFKYNYTVSFAVPDISDGLIEWTSDADLNYIDLKVGHFLRFKIDGIYNVVPKSAQFIPTLNTETEWVINEYVNVDENTTFLQGILVNQGKVIAPGILGTFSYMSTSDYTIGGIAFSETLQGDLYQLHTTYDNVGIAGEVVPEPSSALIGSVLMMFCIGLVIHKKMRK